jgi:hypothetical protein
MRSRSLGRVAGLAVVCLLLTAVSPAWAADQPTPLPTLPVQPTHPAEPTLPAEPTAEPTAAPTDSSAPTDGGAEPTAAPTASSTPTDGGAEPTEPALVFDGVLAVRFMTTDGEPLAGAQIVVKAFPAEGVAFAAQGRTNRNGVATFRDLPRPGDGPPFVWTVDATLRVSQVSGTCTTVTEYAGSGEELATAGARAIPIFAEQVSESESCGAQPSRPSGGGGDNNAPGAGGHAPGGASGGGGGGSALGSPGLTPPATSTERSGPAGGTPLGALLAVLALACGALLRLTPRPR